MVGMALLSLMPRQRAMLKARAHTLEPLVHVGHAGLTAAVVAEVDRSLGAHELIKVRVPVPDREERDALCAALAEQTGAALVGRVGKVLVLWRPRPDQPADQAAGPAH